MPQGGCACNHRQQGIRTRADQPSTRWSALYDLRSGAVRVALGRAYERVHGFGLGMH